MPSSRGSTTARRNNLENTATSRPRSRPPRREESVGSTNNLPSRNEYVKKTYRNLFNRSPTGSINTMINTILNNAPNRSRNQFIRGMTKYNKPGRRIGFIEFGGTRFKNYLRNKLERNQNKPIQVGPVYFQSKSRALKRGVTYVQLALDIKKIINEILYSKNKELSIKAKKDLRIAFEKFAKHMLEGRPTDPELKEKRKKKLWEVIKLFVDAPRFEEFMGGEDEAQVVRIAVSNPSTTVSAVSSAISSGDVSSIAGAVVTTEVSKRAPRTGQILETLFPYAIEFVSKGSIIRTGATQLAGKGVKKVYQMYRTHRTKQKAIQDIMNRIDIPSTVNRNTALKGYARLFNYAQNPNRNNVTNQNVINFMSRENINWNSINKSKITAANKRILKKLIDKQKYYENLEESMNRIRF